MNQAKHQQHSHLVRIALCGILSLWLAASAGAAIYTVTMTNGTTFETRERPVDADWDPNVVMLRTDRGNWIAVPRDEVADVTSAVEASGFGYQLDTSTIVIGWTPADDAALLDEDGGKGQGQGQGESAPPPDAGPINYGGNASYGLDQFLDIPDVGGSVNSVGLPGTAGSGDGN